MIKQPHLKIICLSLAIASLLAGVTYYFTNKSPVEPMIPTNTQPNISTWKTYENAELGFSIKYPAQYVITADVQASGTPRTSAIGSVYITNPEDTSRYEFHVVPMHLVITTQPIIYKGTIYHTLNTYMQSGLFKQNGAINPSGKVVNVHGKKALLYHFISGNTAEDAPTNLYIFIHNDLIYEFYFNANDPNELSMFLSIVWK